VADVPDGVRAHAQGMTTAIITGASRGLGKALATGLAQRGWSLILDARGAEDLSLVAKELSELTTVTALPGDVTDDAHRRELVTAAIRLGGLDLLVNNAGALGPSPLPPLASYPPDALAAVLEANLVAPVALTQLALPLLRASQHGAVLNITSDAAVEAYEGWGGYGASKAALEQASAVLAAEEPAIRVWWVDPGDMRTRMHQDAFPGEDISDRPPPEESVPGLLALLDGHAPSGRYRAREQA
jgi:NAD(P)-dependent dehydrogenase (short-subunit alcohol dehydrogenase family)